MPIIKKAKELGYSVAVADMDENAIGRKYADEFFAVSTIDTEGVLECASRIKIDGITTAATDMPMRTVAVVAKTLGLVGISVESAICATDKAEMMNAFLKNGIAHPWFYVIDNKEKAERLSRELSYPCVIKPVDSAGSRGVMLASNPFEFISAYTYSIEFSKKKLVIVEEFMLGKEVSVEILVSAGDVHVIAVTDKITTGAPYFVEMGHCQPSMLSRDELERVKELATAAVKAVGITVGAAHVEIMVTNEGPKMIELGARLGGDCITSHLVPLSTGVDMLGCQVELCLGKTPNMEKKYSKGSAIKYFSTEPGVIENIETAHSEEIDGVIGITFVKSVGDTVLPVHNSCDRVGFVISQADTAEKALEICDDVLRKTKITIRTS